MCYSARPLNWQHSLTAWQQDPEKNQYPKTSETLWICLRILVWIGIRRGDLQEGNALAPSGMQLRYFFIIFQNHIKLIYIQIPHIPSIILCIQRAEMRSKDFQGMLSPVFRVQGCSSQASPRVPYNSEELLAQKLLWWWWSQSISECTQASSLMNSSLRVVNGVNVLTARSWQRMKDEHMNYETRDELRHMWTEPLSLVFSMRASSNVARTILPGGWMNVQN